MRPFPAMTSRSVPRCLKDATRFTAHSPQALRPGTAAASTAAPESHPHRRLPAQLARPISMAAYPGFPPPSLLSQAQAPPPTPKRGRSNRLPNETLEDRVKRLRQLRDAAIAAQDSPMERFIVAGRRWADAAHRFTVYFILLFSAGIFFSTIYLVSTMMRFNRTRKSEFVTSFETIKHNRLDAARIAFINGSATVEQIALVEEANIAALQAGGKLPPLLSKPRRPREKELSQGVDPAAADADSQAAPRKAWWRWWELLRRS